MRRPSLSTLVFAGAVALSMAAAVLVHAVDRRAARLEFEADAREQHQELEARLESLVALLRGAAGLHAALDVADEASFRAFVDRLQLAQHYPGVHGIGLALRVPADELDAWEAQEREETPGFTVYPRPVVADDAWVIRLLEPMNERNAAAIGLDMGSQPARRVAMERAARTGGPVLTGRVTLMPALTAKEQRGFLVYVPVYEGGTVPATEVERSARILGVSYAPLRAADFFEPLAPPDLPDFAVFAGGAPSEETLLYRSRAPGEHLWRVELPLITPATDWTVRYARPQPEASGSAITAGGLGILLSLGLYLATATAERREQERKRLIARDAAVARAVARMSAGPAEPASMLEGLAAWLLEEGLAAGVDARRGDEVLVQRGEPVNVGITRDLQGITLRVAPSAPERAAEVARILDEGGWVVERAVLHDQAHEALARNEQALAFANLFVGILGHDLRNPLSAISTATQVLQRRLVDPADQEITRRLRASVDRMSRLIDQILDFTRARIGGGIPVNLAPADVALLVADMVAEIRTANPDRDIACSARGESHASVDPDRIAQAVSNLLGNAVQHGAEGPIHVEVDGRDPSAVQIAIRNPGEVPEDVLPTVFEPFRSGQGSAARLGLGMYITRMIVEAHGGSVHMRSGHGETIVRMYLPRNAPPKG